MSDLVAAMPEDAPLAYTSVLTTIRILETKGYVRHRQDGRAYLYTPQVAEEDASRNEIRNVMGRFFGDSRERLLLALLGEEDVSARELERLKAAIAKAASAKKVTNEVEKG